MANLESYKNVWVFAEQRQGKLMNVALELVGEGHKPVSYTHLLRSLIGNLPQNSCCAQCNTQVPCGASEKRPLAIQVQNLTIKYQNTAYLEKIVDFILLFCYIETTSQAGTSPRIHPHKPIRDMNHQYVNARGKGKPAEAMPSTCQEKEPETQWKNQKQQN